MITSLNLIIREIEDFNSSDFEKTFTLINANLPEREVCKKKDFIAVLSMKIKDILKPDNYHLRAGFIDNEVFAASSGYFISDINAGLIHYISVAKDRQNLHLGSKMRKDLLDSFDNDARTLLNKEIEGYLGEVEVTNPWLKTLQKKFNVFSIDINYHQPELECGLGDVPLVLYLQPKKGEIMQLEHSLVERIVRGIYKNVYEILDIDNNSSFQKIMESMKNKKYIGKRTIL